jgi:integrase
MSLPSAKSALEALPPGRHSDGAGLLLQVRKSISGKLTRSWLLRYGHGNRTRDMGLGPYPAVGLAKARELARTERERLKGDRVDPLAARRSRLHAARVEAARTITFQQVGDMYLAAHASEWTNTKHAWQWQQTLSAHAYPKIGRLPVADVDTNLVLQVLEPIWHTIPETARRLQTRLENILDYATAREFRTGDNPARWRTHLKHLLPKRTTGKVPQPALPYTQVPEFVKALHTQEGVAARALEFVILTVVRVGDVCGQLGTKAKPQMRWAHVDLEGRTWTIPNTKTGKPHSVPLSEGAMRVLRQMGRIRIGEHVFPGAHEGKGIGNTSLNKAMRTVPGVWLDPKQGKPATIHGMRSGFRDWCAEVAHAERDVAEAALAHSLGDGTELAYLRSDLLKRRRVLMEAWSRYCTGEGAAKVVLLRKAHADA